MAYFCPVCGVEFVPFTRGKTKTYCSDNCRDIPKFMTALQNRLLLVKPSVRSKKLLAGDLFRLANLVTNGTKC